MTRDEPATLLRRIAVAYRCCDALETHALLPEIIRRIEADAARIAALEAQRNAGETERRKRQLKEAQR